MQYRKISIPEPLFLKIREIIKDTDFRSVADFVTYVCRKELEKHEKLLKLTDLDPQQKK